MFELGAAGIELTAFFGTIARTSGVLRQGALLRLQLLAIWFITACCLYSGLGAK